MFLRIRTVLILISISAITQGHAAILCPQIVNPVCGLTQQGTLQNFSNACFARSAGATVLHAGNCNGTFCPRFCVANQAAVARQVKTGNTKTYDNVCWAEKDHAVFLHYGKCP